MVSLLKAISLKTKTHFNPFMTNGISHRYELDEYVSKFRVVVCMYRFYSNFKRNFCKQTLMPIRNDHKKFVGVRLNSWGVR